MSYAKTIIFIPTLNDSTELESLVDKIQLLLPDCSILLVDDGSELPIEVYRKILKVRLPFNLGLGATTHIAIDYALANGFDNIIRIDADGQHNIEDIPNLLDSLTNGSDIVIATRTNRNLGKGIRNMLNRAARHYIYMMARISCGKSIPSDINSGFMGFTKKAMRYINTLELDRYPEPQIILYSAKSGFSITEVPVQQLEREEGQTSLKVWPAFRLLYRVTIYSILNLFNRQTT